MGRIERGEEGGEEEIPNASGAHWQAGEEVVKRVECTLWLPCLLVLHYGAHQYSCV